MSSFQELKNLERMIDSGKSSPATTFAPQERVIGFQTTTDKPANTTPILIPGKSASIPIKAGTPRESPPVGQWSGLSPENKVSSSLPVDFISYRSQLSGWSASSSASPPTDSNFKIPKEPVKKLTPTPTSVFDQPSSLPIKKVTPTSTPPFDSSIPTKTPPESPASSSTSSSSRTTVEATIGLQKLQVAPNTLPATVVEVSPKLAAGAKPAGKKQQQQQGQQNPNQKKPQQQQQGQQSQKKEAKQQEEKDKTAQPPPTQRKPQTLQHAPVPRQFDDTKKKIIPQVAPSNQVALFAHLPQYEKDTSTAIKGTDIHPAIVALGQMYADFKIAGSNARAVAMLTVFKQVIEEFETPPAKSFHRELDLKIKPLIQYLIDRRPMSISMGNAINYLKQQMTQTVDLSAQEAKEFLVDRIDGFIQERIVLADQVITGFGVSKISDGDVILTFARSNAVESILKKAFEDGKKFRVVVVDSRPKMEGKNLLLNLSHLGIECTYIMLSGISYSMKAVNKVFLGAYSMLSNGSLVSRVGTAVVASVAHAYNVPVMVCCETYKFSERAMLDSICFNQLGNPDELHSAGVGSNFVPAAIKDWRNIDQLKLLNLMYDLTPMEYIVMVITEVGMIPPTSVPVILREYRKEPML